jgi:hypothetical protein
VWLLALMLVAAQALGLAHRVLHGPAFAGGPAGAHVHAHPHSQGRSQGHVHGQALAKPQSDQCVPASAAVEPGVELFDDHAPGGEQCRLLDHAAQADGLSAVVPTLAPMPTGSTQTAPPAALRAGGSAAGYHARRPPSGARRQLPRLTSV